MITLRPALLPVLLATLMLLAACESFRPDPEPPQYLVIEGRGQVEPVAYAANLPWVVPYTTQLKAAVKVPIDPAITDPAQRTVMAQAAARRASLRELSKRILALPDRTQKPLSEVVAQKPELAAALDDLLETQGQLLYKVENGSVIGEAALPGSSVLKLFGRYGAPLSVGIRDLTPDQQQVALQKARTLAIEDAKQRLKQQVFELKGSNGKPLREAFESDATIMRDLDALIYLTPPDDARYMDDGTCIVEIYFDTNLAREIARGGKGAWKWPWQ